MYASLSWLEKQTPKSPANLEKKKRKTVTRSLHVVSIFLFVALPLLLASFVAICGVGRRVKDRKTKNTRKKYNSRTFHKVWILGAFGKETLATDRRAKGLGGGGVYKLEEKDVDVLESYGGISAANSLVQNTSQPVVFHEFLKN